MHSSVSGHSFANDGLFSETDLKFSPLSLEDLDQSFGITDKSLTLRAGIMVDCMSDLDIFDSLVPRASIIGPRICTQYAKFINFSSYHRAKLPKFFLQSCNRDLTAL